MKEEKSVLCFEFSVRLTGHQKKLVDHWMDQSRGIYNHGLRSLLELDEFSGYWNKESKAFNHCCPIPWEYRKLRDDKGDLILEDGKPVYVPFSRIRSEQSWYIKKDMTAVQHILVSTDKEKRQSSWGWKSEGYADQSGFAYFVDGIASVASGYSCPIAVDYHEPLLHRFGLQESGGLGLSIKGDEWRNHAVTSDEIMDMPYKFRAGTLTMLDTPWQEYLKSRYGQNANNRGVPRFKGQRDPINVIIHPNPKGVLRIEGDEIQSIPGIKTIVCRGLKRRWRNPDGSIPPISVFKIVRREDLYFVQLTGEIRRSYPVKQTNRAIGIDPGLAHYFSDSYGNQSGSTRYYRKSHKLRAKLQRKLDDKLFNRLILWLHHPDTRLKDVRGVCQISNKEYEALKQAKTPKDFVDAVGGAKFARLKWSQSSKRQARLQEWQKKVDRTVSGRRKADDDKLTSKIVRNYAFIAVEDLQTNNLRRQNKAKVNNQGTGYDRNMSNAKAGFNISMADATPGRKIAMLERKSKRSGRHFTKVTAINGTKECPVCGALNDTPMDGDRHYSCSCGWHCDRDINASVNYELRAWGLNPHAQLSPMSEKARTLSFNLFEGKKKAKKPTWWASRKK